MVVDHARFSSYQFFLFSTCKSSLGVRVTGHAFGNVLQFFDVSTTKFSVFPLGHGGETYKEEFRKSDDGTSLSGNPEDCGTGQGSPTESPRRGEWAGVACGR